MLHFWVTRLRIPPGNKSAPPHFDPFFTTKSQGMGMGLSICRSIIETHNGRLWASSGVDYGSVFNIMLPAIRPQN